MLMDEGSDVEAGKGNEVEAREGSEVGDVVETGDNEQPDEFLLDDDDDDDDFLLDEELNSENEDDEDLYEARQLLQQFISCRVDKRVRDEGLDNGVNGVPQDEDEVNYWGYNTEYMDSSDEGSYFTSNEVVDEHVRRKSRFSSFDDNNERVEFSLGMKFLSIPEFRKALNNYSVTSRYNVIFAKNTKDFVRAKCAKPECGWKIYAGKEKRANDAIVVKTFHDNHTCNPGFINNRCTSAWLAKNFFSKKIGISTMSVDDMYKMVRKELKCDVSLHKIRRAKGLMAVVYECFPECEHRRCARHLYANWRRAHPGKDLQKYFWKCCKATNIRKFEQFMEEMQRMSPEGHRDMMKVHPKFWCRAFFDRNVKCDIVDNNLCEAFNGTIVPARSMYIYSQLEFIRKMIMKRLVTNRDLTKNWVGGLGPRIRRKINKALLGSFDWRVLFNGVGGYEMSLGTHTYVVDLDNRTCQCGAWDVSDIPCTHAMCAISDKGGIIEDYVSEWFKLDKHIKAYNHMMTPIGGNLFWPRSGNQKPLPPEHLRKKPGRRPMNRRREIGEIPRTGQLTKKGRKMTCQLYFKQGHNKKACPSKEEIMGGSTSFPMIRRNLVVSNEEGRAPQNVVDNSQDIISVASQQSLPSNNL